MLAGTLAGLGLATKASAVISLLPVAGAIVVTGRNAGRTVPRLAWFGLATACWCMPWGVWAWLDAGHPLSPLAASHTSGPGPEGRQIVRREWYGYTRASYVSAIDRLRAPWSLAATEMMFERL